MSVDVDWGHLLVLNGYKDETIEADKILARIWWTDYEPEYSSVEQFLFHPEEAITFCEKARVVMGLSIEDYNILKRLSNLRKSRFLEVMKL
jgi:hypothetical protein